MSEVILGHDSSSQTKTVSIYVDDEDLYGYDTVQGVGVIKVPYAVYVPSLRRCSMSAEIDNALGEYLTTELDKAYVSNDEIRRELDFVRELGCPSKIDPVSKLTTKIRDLCNDWMNATSMSALQSVQPDTDPSNDSRVVLKCASLQPITLDRLTCLTKAEKLIDYTLQDYTEETSDHRLIKAAIEHGTNHARNLFRDHEWPERMSLLERSHVIARATNGLIDRTIKYDQRETTAFGDQAAIWTLDKMSMGYDEQNGKIFVKVASRFTHEGYEQQGELKIYQYDSTITDISAGPIDIYRGQRGADIDEDPI